MRYLSLVLLVVIVMLPLALGQTTPERALEGQLKRVFPELEPLERGYDGPIKMLVGLDTTAHLTGVLVTEHREPYGYFSVDLPEFALQFKGKDIRDPFKVGTDVAAVSRATISINSSSRAIRNGARRLARALLTPSGTSK